MASDRTATLMVRAACLGAVDFTRLEIRDRWWWRRLRWLLDDIERSGMQRAYEAQHRHWVTSFANAKLDDESFKVAQDNAITALNAYLQALLPWQADTFANKPQSDTLEQLLEDYRATYGYPGDPRYEAMLASTMAAFDAANQAPAEGTP